MAKKDNSALIHRCAMSALTAGGKRDSGVEAGIREGQRVAGTGGGGARTDWFRDVRVSEDRPRRPRLAHRGEGLAQDGPRSRFKATGWPLGVLGGFPPRMHSERLKRRLKAFRRHYSRRRR